ncbi:glycoside hydrolase family 30 protein [Sphingomonas sp. PAMC 26621]|uniref:glycoside hydrolase family 30 protein n=1 Tax=Sphingomonas sp. PAMC 26621 TaxID=1112213 RepID=UPI000288B54B|nr:O-glycosyl hydrolase [Sphingomonas sp. PAMC 26621]
MTVLPQILNGSDGKNARDTINSLLPQGKFTPTPVALRTPLNMSTLMQSTTMTAFAPMSALPGTAIFVDPTDQYQLMHGAGAALTESTCYVLSTNCTPTQRRAALQAAFGDDGFSTSRICIGTSDFTHRGTGGYYTYADNDDGSDLTLPNFTIQKDLEYIVPVLREALSINPRLKFIASPWSPPKFMKTINSLIGTVGGVVNRFNGTANNFTAYANYFVKFLKAYKALGIPVWAVTIQNEPHYGPDSYPGCVWSGVDMAAFIKVLGPALALAGLGSVRILTGDMNWKATTGYNGASGDLLLNVWADTRRRVTAPARPGMGTIRAAPSTGSTSSRISAPRTGSIARSTSPKCAPSVRFRTVRFFSSIWRTPSSAASAQAPVL